jgi:hydrogenase maturation protein HypF
MIARHIEISGLVQGVGFRPYVCRLAREITLNGWVRNYGGGLEIFVQGKQTQIDEFQNSILMKPPPGAEIYEIRSEPREFQTLDTFSIKSSKNGSGVDTDISPDLAICESCLKDIYSQPRRYHHLFTSCTHCGPRFYLT